MKLAAVLLAAGSGTRFGSDKLLFPLGGQPVWWHSYQALLLNPEIQQIIVVCSESNFQEIRERIAGRAEVILGGDTRTASSLAGLWRAAQLKCESVLFHDAARPFVSQEVIRRVILAIEGGKAVAAAIPVVDTIKECSVELAHQVMSHLDRSKLWAMQTPQGGPLHWFSEAFSKIQESATDDLELLGKAGFETHVVLGDPINFKITTPEDAIRAQSLMNRENRTGLGYDVHRFSEDPARPLWLGGVHFPGEIGLEGHSDADVVLHAVVDALLGAICAGDIGQLFPNDDPSNKDRASSDFLEAAKVRVREEGWRINHIDIAIQAEKPKIMPRSSEIRSRIAEILDLEPNRISVKATTNEGLGAIGRGEGIATFATASLAR
jgi:2-C-methyl-D-erythritol 4-phosphate cytidylyltransferase / 2-C-methyl-D-erythritol 2,4-cyclodiphosphate synthase